MPKPKDFTKKMETKRKKIAEGIQKSKSTSKAVKEAAWAIATSNVRKSSKKK